MADQFSEPAVAELQPAPVDWLEESNRITGGGDGAADQELRRHLRDLSAVLSLPALWRSRDPGSLVPQLADVLAGLLHEARVRVRFVHPDVGVVEAVRPSTATVPAPAIVAETGASHFVVRPSRNTECWAIEIASPRRDFPTQRERHLMQVTVDLAAIAVENAILLASEQRARRAAEEAQGRAEAANQAKSAFLAMMSHELRTPLNAIAGYVQLLDIGIHGPLTGEQRGTLARIDRSQRLLLRLINDVLNLARLEAGRLDYQLQAVLLDEVVSGLTPLMEPQLRARSLHYETRVPAGVQVWTDPDKLEQILLNLLNNAAKFTSPGGRIVMEIREDIEDHSIYLDVTDTGTGIAPEKLDAVFEPFVQVNASHTRTEGGIGLGLAISRDLARGIGGDLTARSVPGKGSTFTVRLPRHAPLPD
jgi:signal transduction histidine kinase